MFFAIQADNQQRVDHETETYGQFIAEQRKEMRKEVLCLFVTLHQDFSGKTLLLSTLRTRNKTFREINFSGLVHPTN